MFDYGSVQYCQARGEIMILTLLHDSFLSDSHCPCLK